MIITTGTKPTITETKTCTGKRTPTNRSIEGMPKQFAWQPYYRHTDVTLYGINAVRAIATIFVAGMWLMFSPLLIEPVDALANCPNGCQCDDDTLVVKCGEGILDVLPIALNPSIQRLVIKNNKIKTIDSSIQFYVELTFLDLSYNDLITIPEKAFVEQHKLQELHLNHNKIGQINNKTLLGLMSVTVLNLRGNLLAELEASTFRAMTKIEELNLGQNRISHINPHAFNGLINLRVLYLDDNTLTTVPGAVAFQALPSLAELFLGTNSFRTIRPGAFQDLKGLTKLDLRGAGLHNISGDALKGLEGVRYLDLADNRLQKVPTAALANLERLEEFYFGQNDYDSIPSGAFAGLKNLRRLEVTGSQLLRRVESDAFATNTNLEYLNLSSNRMFVEIHPKAFSGLPHLRHVILKDNHLSTLSEGLVPWSDLQTLDLSDNPIICDCRVLWLRNLLVLKNATASAASVDTATSTDSGFSYNSAEQISNVKCSFPEPLRGETLSAVSAPMLGCSFSDPKRQAMIGVALVVVAAATITALVLLMYTCRRRIREMLKGRWGNSALGRKEREYQKTLSDEEYMSRQQHPCSLGVHPSGPYPSASNCSFNTQTQYMGTRPIPVTEL